MELKRLDPSKSVSEIVEVFNFNMNQIYQWWKDEYYENKENSGSEVVVVHGINIKGDGGSVGAKGNSIYFTSEVIQNGSLVPSDIYKKDDYIISNNSIFSIDEEDGELKYSLVGNLGGGVFISPIEGANIVSHSIVGWDTINNSTISVVSPYRRIEDNKIEYYSVHIGDYKKSNGLNSSLVVTNILETKNDGSGTLPTDAMAQTSKKFSQLTLQYRGGFNSDPFPSTATHTFFRGSNGNAENNAQYGYPFIYEMKNGASSVVMKNNSILNRWMLSQDYVATDSVELSTSNVIFFREWNARAMFYHSPDGNNYFLHKEAVSSTVPTLSIGFSTVFTAGAIINNLATSHWGDNGMTSNVIIKDGVLQEPKIKMIYLPIIWSSTNTNGWGDFADNFSTEKTKNVDIGSDRSYFVFGYASKQERTMAVMTPSQGDMDESMWVIRKTYDKVKALQTGNYLVENKFAYTEQAGWGLYSAHRATIVLRIKDTPTNMVYGNKKTIYVKSFGYHPINQSNGFGYYVNLPIKIYDEARGKTLKPSWGANINRSLMLDPLFTPVGQSSTEYYPSSYIYTNDNKFTGSQDGMTVYLYGNDFTIMPKGANAVAGTQLPMTETIGDVRSNCAIFKIELAYFGAGWEIESIIPFNF